MITVRYGTESTNGSEAVLFVMSRRHEAQGMHVVFLIKIDVDRGVVVVVVVFIAAANRGGCIKTSSPNICFHIYNDWISPNRTTRK